MSGIEARYKLAIEEAGSFMAASYQAGVRGDELSARVLDKLAEHSIKVVGKRAVVQLTNMKPNGSFVMRIIGTEMGECVEVTLVPRIHQS